MVAMMQAVVTVDQVTRDHQRLSRDLHITWNLTFISAPIKICIILLAKLFLWSDTQFLRVPRDRINRLRRRCVPRVALHAAMRARLVAINGRYVGARRLFRDMAKVGALLAHVCCEAFCWLAPWRPPAEVRIWSARACHSKVA